MRAEFPIRWPLDQLRTSASKRQKNPFRTTQARAVDNLEAELRRLGAKHAFLTTDIPVTQSGRFYASARCPEDPGAAVHFELRGVAYVIGCDQYPRVGANIHAIGTTVEAMRSIERHGATALLERAVSGFRALPAGGHEAPPVDPPWWDTLGLGNFGPVPTSVICANPDHPMRRALLHAAESVYRHELKSHHPDKGGDGAAMGKLNRALSSAREMLRRDEPVGHG